MQLQERKPALNGADNLRNAKTSATNTINGVTTLNTITRQLETSS